jgi:hypothetical protein
MLIDIEKAEPGMKLLEDVLLPSGAILVNSSRTLTASLIETIAKRGIPKIQVALPEQADQSSQQNSSSAGAVDQQIPNPPHLRSNPDHRQSAPNIKVIISPDAMAVKLCVESVGRDDERLCREAIMEALHAEEVVFGINEKAVASAVEKWNKCKNSLEIENVAVGAPPKAGKDGGYESRIFPIRKYFH